MLLGPNVYNPSHEEPPLSPLLMAAQLLLLPFTAVAGLIIGLVWGGRTGAEIVIGFHACASTCIFIVWLLEDELTARIVFTKAAIAVPQISVLLFCLLLFLL